MNSCLPSTAVSDSHGGITCVAWVEQKEFSRFHYLFPVALILPIARFIICFTQNESCAVQKLHGYSPPILHTYFLRPCHDFYWAGSEVFYVISRSKISWNQCNVIHPAAVAWHLLSSCKWNQMMEFGNQLPFCNSWWFLAEWVFPKRTSTQKAALTKQWWKIQASAEVARVANGPPSQQDYHSHFEPEGQRHHELFWLLTLPILVQDSPWMMPCPRSFQILVPTASTPTGSILENSHSGIWIG